MASKSKSRELSEILKIQIMSGALHPGEQLETIIKLAERYKTTVATVSKAMDFLEQSNLVQRIAGKGIFVCEKKKCRIAIVLDRVFAYSTSAYSSLHIILKEIDQQCMELNWSYELFPNVVDAPSARPFLQKLAQNEFDAVFIGSMYIAQNYDAFFRDRMLYTIGIYNYKQLNYTLNFNTYRMAHDAVLELNRLGCQAIALFDTDVSMEWSSTPDMTKRGYFDGLKRIGKLPDQALYRRIPVSQQGGFDALLELWQTCKERPLGVISSDSLMTFGMIQAAFSSGMKIPEDLIIATHANQGCDAAQFSVPLIKYVNPIGKQIKQKFVNIQNYLKGEIPPFGVDFIDPIKQISGRKIFPVPSDCSEARKTVREKGENASPGN